MFMFNNFKQNNSSDIILLFFKYYNNTNNTNKKIMICIQDLPCLYFRLMNIHYSFLWCLYARVIR